MNLAHLHQADSNITYFLFQSQIEARALVHRNISKKKKRFPTWLIVAYDAHRLFVYGLHGHYQAERLGLPPPHSAPLSYTGQRQVTAAVTEVVCRRPLPDVLT